MLCFCRGNAALRVPKSRRTDKKRQNERRRPTRDGPHKFRSPAAANRSGPTAGRKRPAECTDSWTLKAALGIFLFRTRPLACHGTRNSALGA